MSIIVITGASQGIGRALAEAFSKEHKSQIVLVSRNKDKLDEVASVCNQNGAETLVLPCDVTQMSDVAVMGEEVKSQWGVPDVLINNAGLFQPGSLLEMDVMSFQQQLDVNLSSAFFVTKAFLADMVERGSGSIFYMASVASIRAYAGGAAYCAAKHGLLGLARCVREETKDNGIRVTALLPGATFTPSWDGVDLPEERFMPASDIAQAVLDIHHMTDRTVVEEIVLRPQRGDL
ncbi:MAG: SDR family oxidoreductase [Rhodothermaceae bacterium]|nr:SDR family oxidoreductase [Rhodothermaceae bacterium]